MTDLDLVEEQVYTQEVWEVDWSEYFYQVPNNGTVQKPNVEARLRELFPMFDFDGFFQSIIPEYVVLREEYISFQCSDGWGQELLCSAYDMLDEDLTFLEWHNF